MPRKLALHCLSLSMAGAAELLQTILEGQNIDNILPEQHSRLRKADLYTRKVQQYVGHKRMLD